MQATKALIGNAPAQAVLPAKDIDRARRFYAETLGMETTDVAPSYMFMVKAGEGTQFSVYRPEAKNEARNSSTIVANTMEELRA